MRRLPRVICLLLAATCASGCAQRGKPVRVSYTPPPPTAAPDERALHVAEQAVEGGDVARAKAELARLQPGNLEFTERARFDTVQAEIALHEGRPLIALQTLPRGWQVREPALSQRIERVRGQIYFRLGDPVSAVRILVDREQKLQDPAQIAANRELIWAGLREVPFDGAGVRYAQADAVSQGWIDLARITRSIWADPAALARSLEDWRAKYPQHPATDRILHVAGGAPAADAVDEAREAAAGSRELRRVALLLPLTGPNAATAEALRDGFMAALFRAPEPRPEVQVYDAGSLNETMLDAYQRALSDDADFVIGPVRKEGVAAIAAMGAPPVPVLALNYLEPGLAAPRDLYQFGLSPEDEARQAAEAALAQGLQRAVALVPETEWGTRVLQAFTQRLLELNGRLVDSRTYPGDARDFSQAIRGILAVDDSEARRTALDATLGTRVKFEPRRREDVDFIFIGARPDQALLLIPQLRFHRATGLPVFATASVYDGSAPSEELGGLRFCDAPWMLGGDAGLVQTRDQLRALFPARGKDYSRLLALGYDAYSLMLLIQAAQLVPGSLVPAASGTLSMQVDGAVRRGLSCAEFHRGAVRPLVSAAPEPVR